MKLDENILKTCQGDVYKRQLVCIISVTKVKCLLGEGTVIFPGEEPGNGKP